MSLDVTMPTSQSPAMIRSGASRLLAQLAAWICLRNASIVAS